MATLFAPFVNSSLRPNYVLPLNHRSAQFDGLFECYPMTAGVLKDLKQNSTIVRAANAPTWSGWDELGSGLAHSASTDGATFTSPATTLTRWTMRVWFVARTVGAYRALCVSRTVSLEGLQLSGNGPGKFNYNTANSSGSYDRDTGITVPLYTPCLGAATGDGTTINIYLFYPGGVKTTSYAATNTLGASRVWNSGYDSGAGGRWDGLITDLRTYAKVMSKDELQTHYDHGTRWELAESPSVRMSFMSARPEAAAAVTARRLSLLGAGL